uniref:ATP synthase complex subunit 8 n=1 Tax=Scolytinae sp. BMNH 1040351 TaxID=1903793 RepID=A0A343A683_9CUCU|nr:ATP synthase F0 subunit 8 [Scolytinae sp. BMNH 1040351]
MPQMSPLSWLTLYMFFSMLFMLTVTLNYYIFLYAPKKESSHTTLQKINWKW